MKVLNLFLSNLGEKKKSAEHLFNGTRDTTCVAVASAPISQISLNGGFGARAQRARLNLIAAIAAFDMLSRCWPQVPRPGAKHTGTVKTFGGESSIRHGGWGGNGGGDGEKERRRQKRNRRCE